MLSLKDAIKKEVTEWLSWVPLWRPQKHRGKTKLCKRCTGSPIAEAAGISLDVPHQIRHALLTRIHRVIDREVDNYTRLYLPMLQAELDGAAIWQRKRYDAKLGLPDEVAGLDPDLIFEDSDHPVLFTFAELEEAAMDPEPLPMPPLTELEKEQLRKEMRLAGEHADEIGREACFELLEWRSAITAAITKFVEPQIQSLLDELSSNLDAPN